MITIGQTYEDLINATYTIKVNGKEAKEAEICSKI